MPDHDHDIRNAIHRGGGQTVDIEGVLQELLASGFSIVQGNPREQIGGNNPPLARSIAAETGDFAQVVTGFLEEEYRQYPVQLESLLDGARNLPETITSPEDKEATATVVKQFRDLRAKFEAFQKREKQPYLRGGQAVDQFFFGMIDKIARRSRENRAGASDTLLARITDYDNRLIAEENERRRLAAAETARIAREAQEKADRERREAEEARLKAERARSEERRSVLAAEATQAEQTAAASHVEAAITTAKAEERHIATLVKPADLARNRGNDGTLTTVAQEKYAVMTDRSLLNKDLLWPFIPAAEIEKALRAWAKTVDFNQQMPGAEIGRRNKSVVR